jgi:hypothetical protein
LINQHFFKKKTIFSLKKEKYGLCLLKHIHCRAQCLEEDEPYITMCLPVNYDGWGNDTLGLYEKKG